MEATRTVTLLRTKLHCPQIEENSMTRSDLIDCLNQGVQRKLSLISAPAGYGKTTLLCQWLKTCSRPFVWLSLDEYDSDLRVFLNYFVGAFQVVFIDAFSTTSSILKSPQLPSLPELVSILIEDTIQLPEACILVLEDYQVLGESDVHELMAQFLRYLPQNLHLAIASRVAPPLPLASLRLQQQITEIGAADLRFNSDQIERFWQQTTGKSLSQSIKSLLERQTEGWIAGLKLAAISWGGNTPNRDEAKITEALTNIKKFQIMDYLLEEVLTQQLSSVQEFLLQTSILNFFCSSLCNALLETTKSQDIIEQLKKNNLFLVSLDNQQKWYRYHHLFQDLLKSKLQSRFSQAYIASLHYKAGIWFAENSFVEQGIRYLLKSGDEVSAAKLVEQHRHQCLNQEIGITLEKWLKLLPDRIIQQRPALLLTKAWVLFFYLNLSAIPTLLRAAETLLSQKNWDLAEDELKILRGELNLLRSELLYSQGEGERSLAYAQQALELIPITYEFARTNTIVILGYAAQMLGETETTVRQYFERGIQEAQAYSSTVVPRLLVGLMFCHLISGNLTDLAQIGQTLVPLATEKKKLQTLGLSYFFLGMAYYEWNRLDEAAHYFAAGVDLRYSISSKIFYECMTGLVLTYQAQGQVEKTDPTLKSLLHIITEDSYQIYRASCCYFQAWLRLLQSDLQGAIELQQTIDWRYPVTTGKDSQLSNFNSEISVDSLLFLNVPHLTQARIDLARNTKASLKAAIALLNECLTLTQKWHNIRRQIEILALLALAYDAQKYTEKALESLKESILLARSGRFIRTFVDCGAKIIPLLSQLAEQEVAPDYISQILAAFPANIESNHTLIEPLTSRELEIVKLLQQRLTNQEIAEKLVISPRTVKKHTINIYAKLGIGDRRKAVTRAQALGII